MCKTEKFIIKAKKIHGDKYDYSKTNYVNVYKKMIIKFVLFVLTTGNFGKHQMVI